METIHLKTVDPLSQELLKSAYHRGIKLSWDRYERLQPQDGFLRLGLSCPYGCMQGPCRIDPFGRGPDRGACGLDRDRMVAALLLRLCLSGALEATAGLGLSVPPTPPTSALGQLLRRAADSLGGRNIPGGDIAFSGSLLSRPAESADSLTVQALRLGILALTALAGKKGEPSRNIKVGYGLLAQGAGALIGVCGIPSSDFLGKVRQEVLKNFSGGANFVSLGDWVPSGNGFLPAVCTSGEAELALCSGKIQFVAAGPGADPAIIDLCRTLNIPCATSFHPENTMPAPGQSGVQISGSGGPQFVPDPRLVEEAPVFLDSDRLEEAWKKESPRKWALLGGSDHLQHPLGWISSELGASLQGGNHGVATWGDGALWMVKRGLAKNNPPVRVLDPSLGPVLALKVLAGMGRVQDLGGICFTGLKTCKDLAVALGLAALGLKVLVANPLPLWGSEEVRQNLALKIGAQGGSFTHLDHPAQPQEILDWFTKA